MTNQEKSLDSSSLNWLSKNVDQVVLVKNEGYDFGMWQKVLQGFDWSEIAELCLANDSCFCFKSLDDVLGCLRSLPQEAVALVKSYERAEHLQSWFMVFKGQALNVVREHFQSVHFASLGYSGVVEYGEIALSDRLRQSGFQLGAVFFPSNNHAMNPSLLDVFRMLQSNMPIPLVKRRLFVDRPPTYIIRYCLERGYSSNPNTLLKLMRERASAEALTFLSEVRLSKKVMCSYYWHLVRLTIKHQLKLVWRAFISFRSPNN